MADPSQPQLNVSFDQRAARQKGDVEQTGIGPQPTDSLPTENVEARGQEFASGEQGIDQAAQSVQDVAKDQVDAQHQIFLAKAHTDYQVQAQQTIDNIKRNAQPGESITPSVTKALSTLQQKTTGNVQNPLLQNALTERTEASNDQFLSAAQSYDFGARDKYIKYNYNQSIIGAGDLIKAQDTPQAIQEMAMNKLGELLHTANTSPIDPDQRMDMKLAATKQIGNAAAYAAQLKDNRGWLADHASGLTPEARAMMPDALSRGIRNNNPGNLTGDDQWQGLVGKDDGGYLKFDTPENGLRAMAIDFRNQQDKHGLNTVSDIISKYAPPNTNNTASYIKGVSASMGVQPDQKIDLHDPETMHRMMDAVIRHENGGNPYSGQTGEWAAHEAINGTSTTPPDNQMPHGGTRTSDTIFNMLPLEDQKSLINESIQVEKQQRFMGAQYASQASTQMQMMEQNMEKGITPGQQDLQQVGEFVRNSASPALQGRYEKLAYKAQLTAHANAMGTDAIESTINTLDAQSQSESRDDALAFYQNYQKTRSAAVNKDPLGYWHNQGNQLPPLDFNKPQSIVQRAQIANQVATQYGVSPVDAFMRDDDKTYLTNAIQGSTAQQKLQLLNTLHGNLDEGMYNGVINSLRKNNTVVAAAGDYLGLSRSINSPGGWFGKDQATSSADIANALAQGDSLLHPSDKSKPFPMPSDEKVRQNIQPQYQQVFRNLPQAQDSAFEAIKSYYAYSKMQQGDYSGGVNGEPDQKTLNDATQKVLGMTSKFNGSYALAPWGMDETIFRDRMQRAYTGQAAAAGIDVKTFPFGSVSFQNTGQMGKYLAVTGNGYVVDKKGAQVVIDVNGANTWSTKDLVEPGDMPEEKPISLMSPSELTDAIRAYGPIIDQQLAKYGVKSSGEVQAAPGNLQEINQGLKDLGEEIDKQRGKIK